MQVNSGNTKTDSRARAAVGGVQSWKRRPAQAHPKLSGSSWSPVAMETCTEAKHDGTTSGATKMAYKTQAGQHSQQRKQHTVGHTLQLTDLLNEPHCLNPLNFFVSGEIDTSAERRGEGRGERGRGGEGRGRGEGGEGGGERVR